MCGISKHVSNSVGASGLLPTKDELSEGVGICDDVQRGRSICFRVCNRCLQGKGLGKHATAFGGEVVAMSKYASLARVVVMCNKAKAHAVAAEAAISDDGSVNALEQ